MVGNGLVWSHSDNRPHLGKGEVEPVRVRRNCEHTAGSGLGLGRKVSLGEPVINPVSSDRPKMLTGLDQNDVKAALVLMGHQARKLKPSGK